MKKLSIVVPCYNEQETIYPFLEETQKIESKMKDQLIFDYIFVNDGSKDETLKVLRDVASRFENVHYLIKKTININQYHLFLFHYFLF